LVYHRQSGTRIGTVGVMGTKLLYLVRHGEATGDDESSELTETGRHQAVLLGERLRGVSFTGIHHSPLKRAAQTAEIVGQALPGIEVSPSKLLDDCVPSSPERELLPPRYAAFLDTISPRELEEGPPQAAAALEYFARTSNGDIDSDSDERELLISHNFVLGWFIRDALDAPSWRWMGLNQHNCALTVIRYPADGVRTLVAFNDIGHLPPSVDRW
jgi:broad specificity phosphatase PhoE